MTIELDEAAVEAAVRAGYAAWMLSPWVGMESPEPFDDTAEGYQASWRCEIRAAITAYLAAAARPTPDADEMEREFVGAIKDLAVKAHRVGVYPSSFALREEDVAIKHVMSQYRKAVSR